MKTICLMGSPRPKGNSTTIAKHFCDIAEKLGSQVQTFALNKLKELGEAMAKHNKKYHGEEGPHRAVVYSDDHPAYRRSLRGLSMRVDHRVTAGQEHRDRHNALWEVNLLDLLIRHSNANHKRETIAWSKRRQASAERLAMLLVWRNYMKGRQEKVRGSPTPAMVKGLLKRPLTTAALLRERLFRTRFKLPPQWARYYDRVVLTRGLGRQRRHELSFGY